MPAPLPRAKRRRVAASEADPSLSAVQEDGSGECEGASGVNGGGDGDGDGDWSAAASSGDLQADDDEATLEEEEALAVARGDTKPGDAEVGALALVCNCWRDLARRDRSHARGRWPKVGTRRGGLTGRNRLFC